MSMQEIQAQYPSPRRSSGNLGDGNPESYCVGGALCRWSGLPGMQNEHFPNESTLAIALRHCQPLLGEPASLWYADQITMRNDAGDFVDAWRILELALEYEGEHV